MTAQWKLLVAGLCLTLATGCGAKAKPDPKVGDKPLSVWSKELQDKRLAAAKALGELGAAAKPAAPDLAAAVKDAAWEGLLLDLQMVETFTVVGNTLGGSPEDMAKKAAEKRKPLEDRQKKEEAALVAALDALEKIDSSEISKLGLGDGRLAKLKQMAAGKTQTVQTFTTVGQSIGPIDVPKPKEKE